MKTSELREQSELLDAVNAKAEALLANLKAVKAALDELPSADDLEGMSKTVHCIKQEMEGVVEVFGSDEFPIVDDIRELAAEAASMASRLAESKD